MPVPLLLRGTTVGGPAGTPRFRVSDVLLVPLAHWLHQSLSESFHHAHVPAGGFGVAWLEAPLAVATHIAPLDVLRQYRLAARSGRAALDLSTGRTYPDWPTSAPWAGLHPALPWNPDRAGHVADLDTADQPAAAAVYEDVEDGRALVTWHCRLCHVTDAGHVNNGGPVRWASGWQARRHLDQRHYAPGVPPSRRRYCRSCTRIAELQETATR